MQHLDAQLVGLDDIVSRIQQHNKSHHEAHSASLSKLGSDVQASYNDIGTHFETSFNRIEEFDIEMTDHVGSLRDTLPSLDAGADIRQPLSILREELEADALEEYIVTGETPQRTQYSYPHNLPHTERHDMLLAKLHGSPLPGSPTKSPSKRHTSPSKAQIFTDLSSESDSTRPGSSTPGLKEININTLSSDNIPPLPSLSKIASSEDVLTPLGMPPAKRIQTKLEDGSGSKLPTKKRSMRVTMAGNAAEKVRVEERENSTVDLSKSVGAGSVHPMTRRLRSANSG
jgi:kinesin family protein 11